MKRFIDRAGWALAGALGLMLVLVAARAIQAGPLDPPGPVASTMKTLGDLPPSWHQVLLANNVADECASARFTCVMGKEAVLDHETGLVWETAPSTALVTWTTAAENCNSARAGGRYGWRLPSPDELSSLSIPTSGLPTGHPFTATAGPYWSSAPSAADATLIVTVNPMTSGAAVSSESRGDKNTTRSWCVRGDSAGDLEAQSPFPPSWLTAPLDANDGPSSTQSSRFHGITADVVVDNETGLAWQVAPAATTSNWAAAIQACRRYNPANLHLGWRLPTLAELLSLFTPAGSGTLPTGHPFTGVGGIYWTTTIDISNADSAATVDAILAELQTSSLTSATSSRHWCVRGGPGD